MHPLDRWFRLRLPLAGLAVLASVLVVGWVTQPDRYVLGVAPEQPIPFSHRLHAGDNKIPCLYCHTGAKRSPRAGVPPVGTCMNCHRYTKTDSPAIRTLTRLHEENGTLRWKRVYRLPDHVYFDHRPHVGAGIACQECHGPVESMDRVARVFNMRMGNCLRCHRQGHRYREGLPAVTRGPTHCTACHR